MTAVGTTDHPVWGPQSAITDGRLVLRPFRPGDAWAMREWDQDPETRRFFGYPSLPPRDEHLRRIWWVIRRWGIEYEHGQTVAFLVEAASDGSILGSVELHHVRDDEAEISFMTVPEHRRKGVASRAVRLLAVHAFGLFGISTIFLEHDPANVASEAVARRSGFSEISRSPELVRHVRAVSDSEP